MAFGNSIFSVPEKTWRRKSSLATSSATTRPTPRRVGQSIMGFHAGANHACSCGGMCPKCRAQSGPAHRIEQVEVRADPGTGGVTRASAPPAVATDTITGDPSAMAQFFCLFRASQYGVAEYESAAWIVSSGGGVTLHWWPASFSYNKETFKGVRPTGSIAFVHTHPSSASSQPSRGDKDASSKVGLPLYVISSDAIWRTDGSSDAQVAEDGWWKPYRKTSC
jgi:hypothetical protein